MRQVRTLKNEVLMRSSCQLKLEREIYSLNRATLNQFRSQIFYNTDRIKIFKIYPPVQVVFATIVFSTIVLQVPGYILAGVSLHFMGRRGPTIISHLLVGIFMISCAAIQVGGPNPLPKTLDTISQVTNLSFINLSIRCMQTSTPT